MVEEVAEDYLGELIQRRMIQVAKKSYNEDVQACCVNDLIRELAISEAKDCKFFEISVLDESLFSIRVRRLVVYHGSYGQSLPFTHLRTLLNFTYEGLPESYLKIVYNKAKDLKVIDLEGLSLSHLPHQIGKLVDLRYLGLRNTNFIELPESVGNLFNLHTLDIRGIRCETLPKNLSNNRSLRHLCMGKFYVPLHIDFDGSTVAFPKNENLQNLRNLATFTGIAAGEWIFSSLEMLTNLRHLGIGRVLTLHVDGLANSLSKLDHLYYLKIEGNTIPMLKLGGHHNLYKMILSGGLESFPNLRDLPSNLTKLCLRASNLREDPFPVLMKLPKLKILRLLRDSYLGDSIHCIEGGFLELKEFVIRLDELKHWVVNIGAFPSLRYLTLIQCKSLKKLPKTMATMKSLQELKLLRMSGEFIDSLQENHDSGNYQNIKNVPSVVVKSTLHLKNL